MLKVEIPTTFQLTQLCSPYSPTVLTDLPVNTNRMQARVESRGPKKSSPVLCGNSFMWFPKERLRQKQDSDADRNRWSSRRTQKLAIARISASVIGRHLRRKLAMSPIRSSAGGRFAKDKIVAVVLALPEPFAALALMDGRIEFRDRQELAATDERSFVTQALEVGENIVDASVCEMAVLTLEDKQWRTLAQYSLGP